MLRTVKSCLKYAKSGLSGIILHWDVGPVLCVWYFLIWIKRIKCIWPYIIYGLLDPCGTTTSVTQLFCRMLNENNIRKLNLSTSHTSEKNLAKYCYSCLVKESITSHHITSLFQNLDIHTKGTLVRLYYMWYCFQLWEFGGEEIWYWEFEFGVHDWSDTSVSSLQTPQDTYIPRGECMCTVTLLIGQVKPILLLQEMYCWTTLVYWWQTQIHLGILKHNILDNQRV